MYFVKLAILSVLVILTSCASAPKGPIFEPEINKSDTCLIYLANDKGLHGFPGGLPTKVRYISENGDLRSVEISRTPHGSYIPLRLVAERNYLFDFGKNYSLFFSGKKGSSNYIIVSGKFRTNNADSNSKLLIVNLMTFTDLGAFSLLKGGDTNIFSKTVSSSLISEEMKAYWKVSELLDLN